MTDLEQIISSIAEKSNEKEEKSYEKTKIDHKFDIIERSIDDLLWHERIGDMADIDQITFVSSPPANDTRRLEKEGNHVKIPAYVFTPKGIDSNKTYPTLVFAHGGVHANFDTMYANIVQEMLEQGYLIIAPEYRGSTGYGKDYYKLIDYGGRETEDTFAARNWMVNNHELADSDRIGVLGWSHGGMHALFNALKHPEGYACSFAGVPVTDLVARMGYKEQNYRDLYEADYHIGKPAWKDPGEYRNRSPAWHADKLEIPLRIHATQNDGDLNKIEIDRIKEALDAHEKEYILEFHDEAPGAHKFERIDTQFAKASRSRLYNWLGEYLNPPNENPLSDFD